jgi:NADH:ubiquinone reductase (H+-translocating)
VADVPLGSILPKVGLALGGAAIATGVLRWTFKPRPRYTPSERPPYGKFLNKVLVVGGGFAGYTTAKTLCELTQDRDDFGVMVLSRENYFTFWPMVPGIVGSEVDIGNVAQPLRRPLIEMGASFRPTTARSVPTITSSWRWAASRTSSVSPG